MASKHNFTEAYIRKLEAPSGGDRYYVYDTGQPGLCLMVTATGKKTFYIYRRIRGGRPVRVKGPVFMPEKQSVDQARQWARAEIGKIDKGVDPNAELRQLRTHATFGDAYKHYMANVPLRPRTKREDERIHENHLADLDRRRIGDLEKSEFLTMHGRVSAEHGKYMANRVLEVARKVIFHAIKTMQVYKGENPAANFPKNKEHARKVYLDKREAPRLLAAIDADQDADVRDYLRLLLATGQRKTNVAEMKWADVNLDRGTWRINADESKGGDPIDVSLTEQAVDILKARTNRHPTFVFADETGVIPYFRKGWERVREAAGLPQLHLHDLRRTVGSWLAMSGVQEATIAKILGHSDGNTRATKVYMQIADDSARKALERVGGQIFGTHSKRKAKRAG